MYIDEKNQNDLDINKTGQCNDQIAKLFLVKGQKYIRDKQVWSNFGYYGPGG